MSKTSSACANTNAFARFVRSTTALSARFAFGTTLAAAGSMLCATQAQALPTGGTVAAGTASIPGAGHDAGDVNTLTVTQSTGRAIIDWNGFDTGNGQTVNFNGPTTGSITLNRVNSATKTTFSGALNSNHSVWVINPHGFLFNSTARVNVGSLLLSTAGIIDAEHAGFYNHVGTVYNFNDGSADAASKIVINGAQINSLAHPAPNQNLGDIILQAPAVLINNSSKLTAKGGNIFVGAGKTFSADFTGDGLINYQVTTPSNSNNGVSDGHGHDSDIFIGADSVLDASTAPGVNGGGHVIIIAKVEQDNVLDHVINLGGQYFDGKTDSGGKALSTKNKHYKDNKDVTIGDPIIIADVIKSTCKPTHAPTCKPTPSPTRAPSPTPSGTPGYSPSPTPSGTPGFTPSPTPSSTFSPSPTPSGTPGFTPSPTPSSTFSPSPTPSGTPGFTPSPTPSSTFSPSPTPSSTPPSTFSPSPTPSATFAPSPTPAPAPAGSPGPSPFLKSLFINPLTRPLVSQGDQTVVDTTVDPAVSNVSYARPYLISLPTSFADGKLALLDHGGPNPGSTNLGNLNPSAGGDHPENLKPSAGGNQHAGTKCANSFLDDGWTGTNGCTENDF